MGHLIGYLGSDALVHTYARMRTMYPKGTFFNVIL